MNTKCLECGAAKNKCPVYLALRKESASPRAKGILINAKVLDKVFYLCTLCNSCKEDCPVVKLNFDILKMRELLVLKGSEMESNKKMINNLRKTGNIFGIEKNKIKK